VRLWGVLLLMLVCTTSVFAQSPITPEQKPHFKDMREWKLHFSLGIVAEFRENNQIVLYSFPILAEMPVNDCKKYSYHGNEVYLMSKDRRYIVHKDPMLFRKPPNDWEMWNMMEYGQ